MTCIIENCSSNIFARKLCRKHYAKWQRYGDPLVIKNIYHGLSHTPEYKSWAMMKERCLNPKHIRYDRYGGRGITICERWLDFNNFYVDMGKRLPGTSLDRINPDGNYEPSNCRWATKHQQAANKSNSLMVPGVWREKDSGKWRAYLSVDNKVVLRKRFTSYQKAVAARKKAEKIYDVGLGG